MNHPQGKEKLTNILAICYDGLKIYGKEPEQLGNVNKLFQMMLAEYCIEDIEQAIRFYIKTNTDFPAPADIVNIIERGGKPPLEKAVYVNISKKDGSNRTKDEWEYMRDYERFKMTGEY